MKRLTRNLLDNSIEAFTLALETINRPSVKYRVESFCFLFCNAWELLMKAKLLSDGRKIFHRKKRKQPRRSLSLDECLDSSFVFDGDPVKMNIKAVSELRNNAMHLVIPFVPPDIMGLFQAGVLNYPKILEAWFGIRLSDRVPLGMMALIYDFDPKIHSLEHAKMGRKLPAETVRWLESFQQNLRNQATKLGENMAKFYIPIELKLAIVKNPNKADIVLSSGVSGREALIVEVPKEPDKTHPHRQKDLILLVNQKLGRTPPFNQFDFQCVKKVHKITDKSDLCYLPKFSSPQYSDKLVDWLVRQATKDSNFFTKARHRANIKYKKKKPTKEIAPEDE